jgi:hypothetical protein
VVTDYVKNTFSGNFLSHGEVSLANIYSMMDKKCISILLKDKILQSGFGVLHKTCGRLT